MGINCYACGQESLFPKVKIIPTVSFESELGLETAYFENGSYMKVVGPDVSDPMQLELLNLDFPIKRYECFSGAAAKLDQG